MTREFNLLNQEEKEILNSLALLPCENYSIPELLQFFFVEENEHASFFDAVHDLSTKGFFERNNSLYAIEQSIANEIIEQINPGIEECPRLVNYFSDKMELPKQDFERKFQPIYRQLRSLLEKINKKSLHIAQLSYLLSSNLIKYDKFEDALKYNQIAIEISENIDKKHPLVALFYRDKAFIHKKLGDSDKAIFYSLKDIEILERHHGKYDDLLPASYYALSKTYEGIQNFNKAVEYNLKAIKYEQKKENENPKNLSNLYQNLAYYYAKLNNFHHASLFINKAIETLKNDNGKDKSEFKQLFRDQEKFNSIYKIEKIIRKFKYPIIIITGLGIVAAFWLLYLLIF